MNLLVCDPVYNLLMFLNVYKTKNCIHIFSIAHFWSKLILISRIGENGMYH